MKQPIFERNPDELQSYLAAIIESSDDAVISKSLDGVITSWNASAETMFGYSAAEAIGKHISLIIPPDRLDEEFIILGKVKAGQRIDHFETIRRKKDGSPVNISLTVSPIKNAAGKVVGASKIARDITQQKRTQDELREASKRRDEFLANMSHELRTPMNAVIGLSNILAMSKSLTEKEQTYVATLKQSADSLMSLINNLLDFAKLESGAVELEEIEFDLSEAVERTVSLLKLKAEEKSLDLKVSYGPSLKKYYIGDLLRIQQILTNIVDNAIKFTERGGVQIKLTGESQPENKTLLTIEVADSGIGIPEEKLEMIFDKFIQADASTTRKYGGSGLGLSICRAFAQSMGGKIAVESRVGLGTTFTVMIPLKNSEADAIIEFDQSEQKRARKNVLIVDDYEPNLMVVTAMLDKFDYDYDTAENGIEAFRRFQSRGYDVVLMDVQMHEMDGFESTRRIRAYEQEKKLARTPIIAMTAHVLEKDKHKCVEAGMDDFIPKPFDPVMLEKKLEGFIASVELCVVANL